MQIQPLPGLAFIETTLLSRLQTCFGLHTTGEEGENPKKNQPDRSEDLVEPLIQGERSYDSTDGRRDDHRVPEHRDLFQPQHCFGCRFDDVQSLSCGQESEDPPVGPEIVLLEIKSGGRLTWEEER
jgi:hypothetical protein